LLDVADQECTTVWGVRFCVDYSIEAEVSDVRWGDVDVVYDPQADGTLLVDVIFTDVELPWTASGELAGVPYADSGTGTADELTVSLVFEFSVVSDVIEVDIRDVEVSTTAFDLGLSSDVDSVASYLGVDFEAEARAALEEAVEANLVEDLEAGLEAAFADLAVSESFPVGETTSRVSLTPTSVEVDADGLDVHMAFAVSLEEWMIDSADGGTLYDDHGQPTWSSLSRGAAMALSATGANLLLYARWGGGVFNRSLSIDDLFEVDVTTFSAIFPGVSDPVLVVDSEAPPMIVPLEDGGTLFAFPEMRLDIYDGEATPGAEVYTLYMSILSDSTFFLGEDMIDIDWGRPTAYVDIVIGPEELTPEDTESLQTILESLVSGLLLDENSHLGGLNLPVINGYGLEATGIFSDGADHGYVVAEGDFEAL
jgi:hypothetical protein